MTISLGKVGKAAASAPPTITANWTGGGNSTAGSTLVAVLTGSTTITPVTPAGWTQRFSALGGTVSGDMYVYELVSASALAGLTITISGSPDALALDIIEFLGAGAIDSTTALATAASGTTETTNAITTVATNTVMVGIFDARSGTTTPKTLSTPGAGFTQCQTNNQSAGTTTSITNYVTFDVVSSVQSGVTTTCAINTTSGWKCVLLAYAQATTSLSFPTASKFQLPLPEWYPSQGLDEPARPVLPVAQRSIASGMVQKADARNANSSLQQTVGFSSNATANNLLIACISTNRAAGPTTLTGVTNSQGDNLTQAGGYVNQGNVTVSLWYVTVRSTGPMSVSYTPAAAAASAISILEYTGFQALDGTASNNSAAANLWNLGPIPVSANSDLVIAAFANNNIGNVMTAKGGFVLESDPANTSVACGIYVMDCRVSAGIIAAGTNNTTDNFCAIGASFQTFTPSIPSTWTPFAIRPTTYPEDPVIIQGLTEPARRAYVQTTGFKFQSWTFPLGRKFQEPLPEIEILPSRAQLNTALRTAQSTISQQAATRFAQSASARSQAYGSNVTAGNLLVVCITTFDPTLALTAVHSLTDTLNNNWQRISTNGSGGSGLVSSLWYTITHFSGANTVTVSAGTNVFMSIAALEYTNNTGLIDAESTATGQTSAGNLYPHAGPVPVNAVSDLVVAFFGANDTGTHFSALEGFVMQSEPTNASDNAAVYVMDMSASAPLTAWMNNSTTGIRWTAIVVSFFSGSSSPTHPFQPMSSKYQPPVEEVYVQWVGRKLPVPYLAGFTQATSPWSFPTTIKFQPPLPEPDLTQPSGRPAVPFIYTNGVNPNASSWQPFAQRFMPAPPEEVISQGLTEPARRSIPAIYIGFTRKFAGTFVPWDHHAPTISRRHQQQMSNIVNNLMSSLDIAQEQGNPQAPWRLSYNPNTNLSWQGTPPATIKDAIDRIAAALTLLGKQP